MSASFSKSAHAKAKRKAAYHAAAEQAVVPIVYPTASAVGLDKAMKRLEKLAQPKQESTHYTSGPNPQGVYTSFPKRSCHDIAESNESKPPPLAPVDERLAELRATPEYKDERKQLEQADKPKRQYRRRQVDPEDE